jgi:hypothetical protein
MKFPNEPMISPQSHDIAEMVATPIGTYLWRKSIHEIVDKKYGKYKIERD